MAEIEAYLGNKTDHNSTTLEHVCPYNPTEEWDDYFGEGVNDIQDRLGNMILLEKDDLRRANFEIKQKAYLESHFPLARKVATYSQWNLQNLNAYQTWLSEKAIETWKVSYS